MQKTPWIVNPLTGMDNGRPAMLKHREGEWIMVKALIANPPRQIDNDRDCESYEAIAEPSARVRKIGSNKNYRQEHNPGRLRKNRQPRKQADQQSRAQTPTAACPYEKRQAPGHPKIKHRVIANRAVQRAKHRQQGSERGRK